MTKTLLMLGCVLALGASNVSGQTERKENCGMAAMHKAMIAKDPSWAQRFEEQKASLQERADNYIQMQSMGSLGKTTAVSAIPVVFHIILDSSQFKALGSTAGIKRRCDSAIAVLNRDFNKQNSDSSAIPSSWKAYYGKAGIQFALARRNPSGICVAGYEVKIITSSGFSNIAAGFPEAKTAGTGLPSWDVDKYYNVWCINFTGSASSLLGLAVPRSMTTGWSGYPVNEMGVCILYNTLGKYATGIGTFPGQYNLGRTLTHETGHFFEIWHTWGDDGGKCSTWSSSVSPCAVGIGQDDGIADTPPQADAVYGNPAYTITGGTKTDCCKMNGVVNTQPIGIACLSFMDYTDDAAMHLFTTQQASVMASHVLVSSGENYSLTQNPSLTVACTVAGIESTEANSNLSIYPNPTNGLVSISLNSATETLNEIIILNLVGQQVAVVKGDGKDYYTIDLSGMSKGIYFVKCNFASGSVTRKISLQ